VIAKSTKLSLKNLIPKKQSSLASLPGAPHTGSIHSISGGTGFGGALFGAFSSAGSESAGFQALKPTKMKVFRQMKIKMKIAYSALQAGQPVLDFIINAIIKAFVEYTIPSQ